MKMKKKVKKIVLIILFIALIICGLFAFNRYGFSSSKSRKEVKVNDTIEGYGYNLKSNATHEYEELFNKLKTVLESEEKDEEEYVNLISQMFIIDFYTLDNKLAKSDVGGVDFVFSPILDNFITNAQNTYYRYVESDIYGERKQSLPIVKKVNVESVSQDSFEYTYTSVNEDQEEEEIRGDDDKAYIVKVSWEYTDSEFDDYQNSATLSFIHEWDKLSLVELSKEE